MIRNIINYFSSSSIIFILGIFLLPIYTRFLTPIDYGILALYVAFGQIFTNIISLGLDTANFRYFFKDKNKSGDFKVTNSTNLVILIILLFIGFGFTYFTLDFFEDFVFKKKISKNVILISYIFASLFRVYQYFFRLLIAQERSLLFALLQVLYFIIGNTASLILIIFFSFNYMGKIYGDLLSVFLSLVLSIYLQRKYIGILFSINKAKRSFKFALPLTPNKVMGSIQTNADKYIISIYRNLSELGIYELSQRLSNLNRLFVDNVFRAWQPYFYNNINKNNDIIIDIYCKIIFFLSIFYLSFIFFSEEIVYILTTPDFYQATYLMPLIICSMFFSITSAAIYSVQIMYSERTKYIIPITFLEIVINVSLNIVFIPLFGIFGAIISLLASSIFSSLVGFFYGQKACTLPIKYNKIFLVYIFLFFSSLFQLYFIDYNVDMVLKIIIKLLIIFLYILILCLIKFISVKDFQYLIKNFTKIISK